MGNLDEALTQLAITHGLDPHSLPRIEDFEHDTMECGCRSFRKNGAPAGPHTCCRCQDAGFVYVPLPASERVRREPSEQVTVCPCQRGRPDPSWAEESQIPAMYRSCRYETFRADQDEEALMTVRLYTESWPPTKPLLVLGSPTKGNGKTHLAVAAMYDVWGRHRVRSQFWSVPDLMQTLRAAESAGQDTVAAVMGSLRRYPLVVLDDLGAQRDTSYTGEQLYNLINHRYANALPTIVTTNSDGSQLDERIASRLSDMRYGCIVSMNGRDFRRRTV